MGWNQRKGWAWGESEEVYPLAVPAGGTAPRSETSAECGEILCENHVVLTTQGYSFLSAHAHTYFLLVCERRLFPEVLITLGHKHEELHGLSINPQPLEYALHVPARQGDEGEGKMSRGAWAD